MPVPDAPMTPIPPCGKTLAKASGLPAIIAVPQSGPITMSPFSRASVFSSTSCSSGTLSENSITLLLANNPSFATPAEYSPATETSNRFASGNFWQALSQRRALTSCAELPDALAIALSSFSNCSRIKSRISGCASCVRTATQISLGVASAKSGCQNPVDSSIDLVAGVPIMTET